MLGHLSLRTLLVAVGVLRVSSRTVYLAWIKRFKEAIHLESICVWIKFFLNNTFKSQLTLKKLWRDWISSCSTCFKMVNEKTLWSIIFRCFCFHTNADIAWATFFIRPETQVSIRDDHALNQQQQQQRTERWCTQSNKIMLLLLKNAYKDNIFPFSKSSEYSSWCFAS